MGKGEVRRCESNVRGQLRRSERRRAKILARPRTASLVTASLPLFAWASRLDREQLDSFVSNRAGQAGWSAKLMTTCGASTPFSCGAIVVAASARQQAPAEQPRVRRSRQSRTAPNARSPRNANYEIDARLDDRQIDQGAGNDSLAQHHRSVNLRAAASSVLERLARSGPPGCVSGR